MLCLPSRSPVPRTWHQLPPYLLPLVWLWPWTTTATTASSCVNSPPAFQRPSPKCLEAFLCSRRINHISIQRLLHFSSLWSALPVCRASSEHLGCFAAVLFVQSGISFCCCTLLFSSISPLFFSCFSLLLGIFGAPQTVWLHKDEESSLLGVVCACFAAHSQQNTKLQLAKRLRCALIGWRRGKCARIVFS